MEAAHRRTTTRVLIFVGDPQLRPVFFGLQDRRLPLPGQILEAVRVEHRLVELAPLLRAHVAQRRVAVYLLDAAAQVGARHWQSLDRTGYPAAMLSLWSDCCFCMEAE